MKRIKVEIPEKFSFETAIKVRVRDMNYGNHISNDSFLTFAHDARIDVSDQQTTSCA